jgi:mRNA-degrading endonuclease toxin of MazEF toxin-antitoxin module
MKRGDIYYAKLEPMLGSEAELYQITGETLCS